MFGGAMTSEAPLEWVTMTSIEPVAGENLRLSLVVFGAHGGFA
jgi:hypothetical protein